MTEFRNDVRMTESWAKDLGSIIAAGDKPIAVFAIIRDEDGHPKLNLRVVAPAIEVLKKSSPIAKAEMSHHIDQLIAALKRLMEL